jgi:cysteine desulfurase/selenocysteine lyase
LEFIAGLDREKITGQSRALLDYATDELNRIPGLTIIGQAREKAGILSFTLADAHPHDIATILSEQQICIRAGHHCTQPLLDFLDLPGTARASFSVYNTEADVVRLVKGVREVLRLMGD